MRKILGIGATVIYVGLGLAALDVADNWGFWKRYFNPPSDPVEWPASAYDVTADMRSAIPSVIPTQTPEQAGLALAELESAATWRDI